ncbi:glycosyltransferase family 4 protein [candidate division WWE3 bacterium]|nr:glycosyltransferase family 4 protein [candidate division WWE3 bacterium]
MLTTQKEFVTCSDKVVAVSEFVKTCLVKETGVAERNVEVIYNGVYPREWRGKRGDARVGILYVGRIEEDKGVFEASERLLKESAKHNSKLIVVGGGEGSERLKRILAGEARLGKVIIAGPLKEEELGRYYRKSHIFILPTKRLEGFPMTIPEAMMHSLPVVAFNLGGVSEGIEDGKDGYLVDSGDWEDFAHKVFMLADSREKREELGMNAYAKAKSRFSQDVMVKKYLKALKEVLIASRT